MTGSKINRRADAAHAKDPARNNRNSDGGKRVPSPSAPGLANKSLTHSRLTDTLLLAHRFASRFQEPQPHGTHRAESAGDNASYRKSAKRPANKRQIASKKS